MARSRPVQREKAEQANIVQLLRSIGSAVYVLGTRRPRGEYQGTCQTPGIPDLFVFLPTLGNVCRSVWIEVKAADGRLSDAQTAFSVLCKTSNTAYVTGGLGVVIAWLIHNGYLADTQVPHYRQVNET